MLTSLWNACQALLGGATGQVLTKNTGADLDFSWRAGGGGGGAVQSAKVVLTDAQFRALPTTPQTLVAAPGAGKILIPLQVVFTCHFSAGAYASDVVDQNGLAILIGPTDWGDLVNTTDVGTVFNSLLVSTTDACYQVPMESQQFSTDWGGTIPINSALIYASVVNQPLTIKCYKTGNITGGNAANTFVVSVAYTTIDA